MQRHLWDRRDIPFDPRLVLAWCGREVPASQVRRTLPHVSCQQCLAAVQTFLNDIDRPSVVSGGGTA
jgi:hypothetical protein